MTAVGGNSLHSDENACFAPAHDYAKTIVIPTTADISNVINQLLASGCSINAQVKFDYQCKGLFWLFEKFKFPCLCTICARF